MLQHQDVLCDSLVQTDKERLEWGRRGFLSAGAVLDIDKQVISSCSRAEPFNWHVHSEGL